MLTKSEMFTTVPENVLFQALHEAAGCKDYNDLNTLYNYIENTPRCSLTISIIDELYKIGFEIVRKPPEAR